MKKYIAFIIILFGTTCSFGVAKIAYADLGGLNDAASEAFRGKGAVPFSRLTLAAFPGVIGSLIGNVLAFLGVIFFVLIIYAGILWMTAAGNDSKIKDAQKIMKNAIVGLIIVLSAYIITAFVGRLFTTTT